MSLTVPLVRTPSQILNNLLSDFLAAMFQAGYTSVNANPGSDIYIVFKSVADQMAVLDASVLGQANADMPDTATGDDLTRLAANYGLVRKSATSAVGYIQLSTTNPTTVIAGATLSVNSLSYQVVIGGVYANNALIFVQAVSIGAGTNQAIGTVLTWSSGQPLFSTNTAICYTALTGGADAEDDASLRNRLLAQFANPPAMGNWQDIINLATSYDPLVQNAFVYGDINGPGTFHVALVGYQTSSDATRTVPNLSLQATTAGLVANITIGLIPGMLVTVTTPVAASIAFQLSLPQPAGTNNSQGWVNPAPWPAIDMVNLSGPPQVISVSTPANFVISATSVAHGGIAPIANSTSISWVDTSDDAGNGPQAVASVIQSFTDNGNNTWTLNLATPFNNSQGGVKVGHYIWPTSVNQQTYVQNVYADFAAQGPGQKTNSGAVLPFALRQPLSNNSGSATQYLDTIGVSFLRSLENNVEVGTAIFAYNSTNGQEPPLPSNINGNPNLWIPATSQLGFYSV